MFLAPIIVRTTLGTLHAGHTVTLFIKYSCSNATPMGCRLVLVGLGYSVVLSGGHFRLLKGGDAAPGGSQGARQTIKRSGLIWYIDV